mmetsp:Transcript_34557/g.101557  ORF Transcript_34557/g.101557 Transcript_34557/m.101557 type:complete len:176 (-) Transcript_34557:124-651(-)
MIKKHTPQLGYKTLDHLHLSDSSSSNSFMSHDELLGSNGGIDLRTALCIRGAGRDALAPIANGIHKLGRILLRAATFRHVGRGVLTVAAARGTIEGHSAEVIDVVEQADGPRRDDVLETADGEGGVVRALEAFGDGGEQRGMRRVPSGQDGDEEDGQEGESRSAHGCDLVADMKV